MKWYLRRRRFIAFAVLTMGTTLQLTACQQQASLFGVRVLFSAFTLPINQLILAFFDAIAGVLPQGGFFPLF